MKPISKSLILMTFVVSACGGDPNPDGGGGAGATGAGATGAGGGAGGGGAGGGATSSTTSTSSSSAVSTTSSGGMGGACHELVNDAPAIAVEPGAGPLPIPEGGAIADGRYHLTSYVVYFDVSPPPTIESTIVIDGELFDDVTSLDGRDSQSRLGFSTEGAFLNLESLCGDPWNPSSFTYTATSDELVLIDPGYLQVITYTRVD